MNIIAALRAERDEAREVCPEYWCPVCECDTPSTDEEFCCLTCGADTLSPKDQIAHHLARAISAESERDALRARVAALEGLLERWMSAYDDGEPQGVIYTDTDEALAERTATEKGGK